VKLEHIFRRAFGRGSEDTLPGLGELERRVMQALWTGGAMSVRALRDAFADELAYTTLMTTMDRLFSKGFLERRKEGRAFVYKTTDEPRGVPAGSRPGTARAPHGPRPRDRAADPVLHRRGVSERDRDLLDDLERFGAGQAPRPRERKALVSEMLKGLALGLVSFLALNAAASALTLVLSRLRPPSGGSMPPARCARALFALRLFPAVASTLAILLYFVPAYMALEPFGSGETVGRPLLAAASLAGALLVAATGRGLRTWHETRRLARVLAQGAEPITLPESRFRRTGSATRFRW